MQDHKQEAGQQDLIAERLFGARQTRAALIDALVRGEAEETPDGTKTAAKRSACVLSFAAPTGPRL